MGKVTFDLSPELERALEQIAQHSGRPQDAVLQEAVKSYVAQRNEEREQAQMLSPIHPGDVAQLRDDDAKVQAEAMRRGRPFFRSLGVGSDPELKARDSEDWLRANWRPA